MKISRIGRVLIFSFALCLCLASTAHATNYTLTVSAQGSGTVSKNPTNSTYPSGVTVVVTASPNGGWFFSNWSGDTNGSINPLNVTMHSALVITGNFLPYPDYTLTLVTNGQGAIGLNPPSGSYQSNSLVTATATPANGWVFTGWSDATNTSANPVSLAIDSNLTLSGSFAQLPTFDVQPAGVTNTVGSTVDFSSHAMGASPLKYQWYFTGGSLGDATNATLVLTNASFGQAGNYWVIATNNYGSATSSVVTLVLTNPVGPTNIVSSPNEASLRAAIALGGWIGINFNGTVTITNTINITNNVILDASGVSATISGGNAVRLFYVAPGIAFSATNLILANGSYIVTDGEVETPADGGAIYNDDGVVTLVACTFTNNYAESLFATNGLARGGAIFNNGGSVSLIGSSLSSNGVVGGIFAFGSANYFISSGGCGLGGAMFNTNGAINIVNCTINNNSTMSAGTGMPWTISSSYGGALFQASGSLTISNSLFSGNLALGADGITFEGQKVDVAQSAYGGAIADIGGSVVIERSQFSGNTAQGGNHGYGSDNGVVVGGAIYNDATLTASYSTFSKNQAICGTNQNGGANGDGGAIYNLGAATFNDCSIYSNVVEGGSAIELNTHSYDGGPGLGGGIFNASQLSATNCTIALNTAMSGSGSPEEFDGDPPAGMNGNALGGGVFNDSSATFTALNLTIASNYCIGGGAEYFGSNGVAAGTQVANTNGTLTLHNCIIAYGGTAGNAYGPITDAGFNISSDGSANLNSGSSYSFTDPQLGPLANYGRPTLCMALLPSSPAIDSADSSDFPSTDQRGFFRPIGSGPDIGAYEYGSQLPGPPYLNVAASTGNVQLSFLALPSHMYLLQASINLATWTDLSTNGPFASGTIIAQTISQQGFPVRYYRLVMQ